MSFEVTKIIGDINQINEVDELHQINSVLCARVKALNSVNNHVKAMDFAIGDMVAWQSKKGTHERRSGRLVKKNRTRAVIMTSDNVSWTVPFNMLEKERENG